VGPIALLVFCSLGAGDALEQTPSVLNLQLLN
jgi:hypothetical protein